MSKLNKKIGFAVTGSFCTFSQAFSCAENLVELGYELIPIMSFNSYNLSTRFGSAEDNRNKLEKICQHKIISTIEDAEPIGPKKLLDMVLVAPCSGNTLAKLAYGVNDTPVTMAVKSHLRNKGPVVIAVSTNDALANSAKNIGILQNYRNYFFVPYSQDDYIKKPTSLVADFSIIPETISFAFDGEQLNPIFR